MTNHGTKGIVVVDATNAVVSDNTIVGFDTGVHMEGGTNNVARSNSIISLDAVRLFAALQSAVEKAEIPAEGKQAVVQAIAEMRQSAGSPGFVQKYQKFMEILAVHMTVLAPVVGPLLPELAKLLA
jgi:parallel beta-helix repeat protein